MKTGLIMIFAESQERGRGERLTLILISGSEVYARRHKVVSANVQRPTTIDQSLGLSRCKADQLSRRIYNRALADHPIVREDSQVSPSLALDV